METSYSYMKDGNIKLGDSITITDELKPIKIGYKIYFTEREVLNLYPELKAYEKVKLFHGYDCITQFFVDLKKVSYEIQLRIRYQIPLSLTSQERQDFEKSTHCCICKRSYSSDIDEQGNIRDPGLRRCKHHSHISGWIFEGTNQYNVSFFVSGGFLLLAGIISCVVDLLKRKRDR